MTWFEAGEAAATSGDLSSDFPPPSEPGHGIGGKRWLVLALVALYLVVSGATFARFYTANWYPVTGDEPHYLVMASGIVHDHTLEQTLPYEQEFNSRTIYPEGLAPPGSITSPANAAVYPGPHGLFNYHDAGLPFLLAPGFALGGVLGAKLEMVLLLASVVAVAGWLSLKEISSLPIALAVGAAVSIGLPLLPAASQVYPDLPGGAITLGVLAIFIAGAKRRALLADVGIAFALGLLPWLHLKFLAAAMILVVAYALRFVRLAQNRRLGIFLGVFFTLLGLLGFYNLYAFGHILGPYASITGNAANAAMVLLGLLVDQHQGIFAQQPLYLLGAFWMVRCAFTRQLWAWLTLLLFMSFYVPNGIFPNLYGGYAFAGRFQWSASMLLIIPSVFALKRIWSRRPRVAVMLTVGALVLQAIFALEYLVKRFDFYTVVGNTWLSQYPSLWGPLAKFMPALYDSSWAYSYWPNLIAVVLLVIAVVAAVLGVRRILVALTTAALASLLVVGVAVAEPAPPQVFLGSLLPTSVGSVVGTAREASAGSAAAGELTFGPYESLGAGSYRFSLSYSASAATDSTSIWDLVCGTPNTLAVATITAGILQPTTGRSATLLQVPFSVDAAQAPCLVQFRTSYGGKGTVKVDKVTLSLVP